jgi:hypothetical protein
MKGSRFNKEQIIGILREHEAGAKVPGNISAAWNLDFGVRQLIDSVPAAGRIVMRIARTPDDLCGEALRQPLDHLLGIEPQHHVPFLPECLP